MSPRSRMYLTERLSFHVARDRAGFISAEVAERQYFAWRDVALPVDLAADLAADFLAQLPCFRPIGTAQELFQYLHFEHAVGIELLSGEHVTRRAGNKIAQQCPARNRYDHRAGNQVAGAHMIAI